MSDLEKQKKLTDGKGWKLIKDVQPSDKFKKKIKKIAEPFVEESVAIKSITEKKDK